MAALNRLQIVNARENVYYHAAELGSWLVQAAPELATMREAHKPRLVEAVEDGNENSSLLHQFWPMPQLALELSFAAIRPIAKRVPLWNRARQLRSPYATAPSRHERSGTARRFEVRARY